MPGSPAMGHGGGGARQDGGQGSPAVPRRAAGAPGPAQEQPAACASGTARQPRRCGGVPTAVVPESGGREVREGEESTRKLTAGFNWAEKGRKTRIDGGAELRRPTMAAAAGRWPWAVASGLGSFAGRRRSRSRGRLGRRRSEGGAPR